MLALALRALFSRYTTHIFAHPFGSPPTAPEAQWARGSSVAWAEYTRFSAEASRQFGLPAASEPLPLAALDAAAHNKSRLVDLGALPAALVHPAPSQRPRVLPHS